MKRPFYPSSLQIAAAGVSRVADQQNPRISGNLSVSSQSSEKEEENSSVVVTLNLLKQKMHDFAQQRLGALPQSQKSPFGSWEVGELAEIFQWRGEVAKGLPDWKEEDKIHLGEELSDVLLYLVRLSDICGIDLGKAALRKFDLNATKYPPPSISNNATST